MKEFTLAIVLIYLTHFQSQLLLWADSVVGCSLRLSFHIEEDTESIQCTCTKVEADRRNCSLLFDIAHPEDVKLKLTEVDIVEVVIDNTMCLNKVKALWDYATGTAEDGDRPIRLDFLELLDRAAR